MTGGTGGAAGNDGVPVLQGLVGGSATGVLFPSLVCSGARVAETSRSEPPEMCVSLWSIFLTLGPEFCTGRKPTVGLLADRRLAPGGVRVACGPSRTRGGAYPETGMRSYPGLRVGSTLCPFEPRGGATETRPGLCRLSVWT